MVVACGGNNWSSVGNNWRGVGNNSRCQMVVDGKGGSLGNWGVNGNRSRSGVDCSVPSKSMADVANAVADMTNTVGHHSRGGVGNNCGSSMSNDWS